MKIRAAVEDDAATLTAIAHDAKRSWGYPPEWLRAWDASLTIEAESIETMRMFVAEVDGEGIVGFYALAGEGPSMQLEHLWIRPDQMGRGLGRSMVAHAVAVASEHGAERLVIESDPHAEAFYRRIGATPVGAVAAPMPGAPNRALPVLQIELGPRT